MENLSFRNNQLNHRLHFFPPKKNNNNKTKQNKTNVNVTAEMYTYHICGEYAHLNLIESINHVAQVSRFHHWLMKTVFS